MKTFSLEESLRAQQALRRAARLGPEQFPIEAFVGMISDEVETLHSQGMTDERITVLIHEASGIEISAAELADNYEADRHPPR